jgi:hypothetical protein
MMISLQPLSPREQNMVIEQPPEPLISKAYNTSTVRQSNPYNVPDHQLKDILPNPTSFEEDFYNPDVWCTNRSLR